MELKNFKTMDENMLISILNAELRDNFNDLEDLTSFYDISTAEVLEKLKSMGYEYIPKENQFKN